VPAHALTLGIITNFVKAEAHATLALYSLTRRGEQS